jgi:hypothetical protein
LRPISGQDEEIKVIKTNIGLLSAFIWDVACDGS